MGGILVRQAFDQVDLGMTMMMRFCGDADDDEDDDILW